MPIFLDEPAVEYQARQALSASMAWELVNECPALAYHNSPFNPERKPDNAKHFDFGIAIHLAVLEPEKLADRIFVIDAKDFRTKAAQEQRDMAYVGKQIPLLWEDFEIVKRMRKHLEASPAADLLFGEGQNEVSYTWEWAGVPCKARADRLVGNKIIDLKSASSASPAAFQRAMTRDGHHVRAAWYLDGYAELWRYSLADAGTIIPDEMPVRVNGSEYLFVVVGKDKPHLVQTYQIGEHSLVRGRTLYRKALSECRQCLTTGIWRGYGPSVSGEDKIIDINLPAWALNLFDAQEKAGVYDIATEPEDDESDIPY